MRKIYILPNLFTTANMFCGYFAIISALHGNFITASWAIFVAMIFDSMDGRVARLARATSSFGVEYDSLSDLLSFGVAPSIMVYLWCLEPFGRLGYLASFLYVVCAALRLARFNVNTGSVPKNYFQGLPSPLAAVTIATAILFYTDLELDIRKDRLMLGITFLMASLMISTIRFPSFKEFKVNKENSFGILAIGVLTLVLVAVRPEVTLFSMCILYTTIGILAEAFRVLFGREAKTAVDAKDVSVTHEKN